MRGMIVIAAALCAACATTSDYTARQRDLAEARVTGINEDGERVRCERIRETGSRFTERVCRTEREWELIEENARQVAEDSHNRWPRDCGPEPGAPPRC